MEFISYYFDTVGQFRGKIYGLEKFDTYLGAACRNVTTSRGDCKSITLVQDEIKYQNDQLSMLEPDDLDDIKFANKQLASLSSMDAGGLVYDRWDGSDLEELPSEAAAQAMFEHGKAVFSICVGDGYFIVECWDEEIASSIEIEKIHDCVLRSRLAGGDSIGLGMRVQDSIGHRLFVVGDLCLYESWDCGGVFLVDCIEHRIEELLKKWKSEGKL